jgi:PKD repeat protein
MPDPKHTTLTFLILILLLAVMLVTAPTGAEAVLTNGTSSIGVNQTQELKDSAALPGPQHIFINVANDAGVKYNMDGASLGGPDNTYYIKADKGGLNELHITNSVNAPYGQVTTSSAQSGTFYISNTGGRGSDDDLLLLVSVKGPIPDDFSFHVKSSGYTWTPSTVMNANPTEYNYVTGVDETFTKSDLIYGPQTWKPGSGYLPLYYGQDINDASTAQYLMFIDLKAGNMKPATFPDDTLINNGALKVDYSFTNMNTCAAFNGYAWDLSTTQGQGITWTNQPFTDAASGYTVTGIPRPTIATTVPTTIATTVPTTIATIVPTTIATTVPTTIATTVPTTIATTVPTTIATTVPTTIATIVPTTIATTVPTTIATTVPTTIATTVPTTIATTVPTTIATTIATTVPTTIATTIATTVPTTIATTVPTNIPTTTIVTPTPTATVQPMVANFTENTTAGQSPLAVQFNESTTGSIQYYLWQFGDGATSLDQNPIHVYDTVGTYNVSLYIIGLTETQVKTVEHCITVTAPGTPTPTISPNVTTPAPTATTITPTTSVTPVPTSTGKDLPVANFVVTYPSGSGSMGIQVTDASMNATSVKYDLGDGTTTAYKNFKYTYWQAGTYTLKQTATNAVGSSTKTITVTLPAGSPPSIDPNLPVANFTVTFPGGPGSMGIQVTDTSMNATSVKYDLGDGTFTSYPKFRYIYWKAGTYFLKLTATNAAGSSIKTVSLTVPVVAL